MMTDLSIKVAVVQFGDAEGLDEKIVKAIAANIDWYVFSENEDKDFAINDLKEHYDLVLEVK